MVFEQKKSILRPEGHSSVLYAPFPYFINVRHFPDFWLHKVVDSSGQIDFHLKFVNFYKDQKSRKSKYFSLIFRQESRNGKSQSHDNIEWDFSSDSDIAGNSSMERPKRRSKALSRNNSITFADRDQVMYMK